MLGQSKSIDVARASDVILSKSFESSSGSMSLRGVAKYRRLRSLAVYAMVCVGAAAVAFGTYGWVSSQADIGSAANEFPNHSTFQAGVTTFGFPVVRNPTRSQSAAGLAHQSFLSEVPDRRSLSPSFCIHALHANGRDALVTIAASGEQLRVLDLFFDSELSRKYFGHPMIVRTAHGVRYPSLQESAYITRGDAAHRDQVLASLGELGVSLTTSITVNGRSYTLNDVLADSIAEFHLAQHELAWTAIVYAVYLSPGSQWTNKYGETYGFNELAGALVNIATALQWTAIVTLVYAAVRFGCVQILRTRFRVDQTAHASIGVMK